MTKTRRQADKLGKAKRHEEVIAMFRRGGRMALSPVVNAPGEQLLVFDVHEDDDRPCVYLWIDEAADGGPEVLYIGKTALGLRVRQKTHWRASMREGRGQVTGRRLVRLIKKGAEISIWVMHPKPVRIGEDVVPIQAAVEEFLLAVIEPKPILNKEGAKSPRLVELDAPA